MKDLTPSIISLEKLFHGATPFHSVAKDKRAPTLGLIKCPAQLFRLYIKGKLGTMIV
jgi:hypothetical protein